MTPSLEFIGNATTLLRLGPFTMLTDPNFLHRGQRAYLGNGLFSKRLTEPAMQPADLPPLDGVVLSHLHADHFDRIARDQLDRELLIASTPAASRKLGQWGFGGAHGMRTWETVELTSGASRLRITAVPGQHGPGLTKHLLPPVMGSVLELVEPDRLPFRVYISGDTLFRPYLRDVLDRTGPLDAALVHLGGTRAFGLLVTMDDHQGADLVELLEPAVTVPVHFDDYSVFTSSREEFLERCRERGLPTVLRTVDRGQRIDLG